MREEGRRASAGPASRARFLVLSLLTVLGVIAMHGTPSMAAPSGGHDAAAAAMTAMAHTVSTDDAARTMSAELPGAIEAQGAQRQPVSAGTRAPADHGPGQHHMLQPCVSDTVRTHHLAMPSLGIVGLATPTCSSLTSCVQALAVPVRDSWPPDLTKLCISRT